MINVFQILDILGAMCGYYGQYEETYSLEARYR